MTANYINTYNNVRSPKVENEIDTYTFLDSISNPDSEILDKIHQARYFKSNGNKDAYEGIKFNLPCYTLNFSFNNYKKNENIKGSTGLMYIDMDNDTSIDLSNQYIFASWKSLSNNGRGVLIRVEGLNLNNFRHNYVIASDLLGIEADKNAAKPTQFNIQSYDKELYLNDYSEVLIAESVTFNTISKSRKKDRTECITYGNLKIRFNTINEYDFMNKDYIFFPEEKEAFYEIYIPQIIPIGKRNQTVYAIGCQFRGLNNFIDFAELINFLNLVNRFCLPPMEVVEIKEIAKSIMAIKDIEPIRVTPRRILFNPKSKLTRIEKVKTTNKLGGKRRSAITQNKIKEVIKNWNTKIDGKMSNTAIGKKIGINRATVGRQLKKIEADKECKN